MYPLDDVYDDIRDKLIAKGIPSEEIAYIHEAKIEKQKADLFDKVRNGEIRVPLGTPIPTSITIGSAQDVVVSINTNSTKATAIIAIFLFPNMNIRNTALKFFIHHIKRNG